MAGALPRTPAGAYGIMDWWSQRAGVEGHGARGSLHRVMSVGPVCSDFRWRVVSPPVPE